MTQATDEMWRVRSYMSGTINVEHGGPMSTVPWVGIHYRAKSHEIGGATDDDRYDLAERIARVLNGTEPTSGEFIRETETTGNWRGIRFSAIGPMIDKRPPTCWWIEDDSIQANIARFHLMDSICGKRVADDAGAD